MPTATFNGRVIAKSDDTVVVEGNHYFPMDSLDTTLIRDSDVKTNCPWKGEASYFDVVADDQTAEYAAWYYPDPKPAADNIKNRVAFWRGVEVSDD